MNKKLQVFVSSTYTDLQAEIILIRNSPNSSKGKISFSDIAAIDRTVPVASIY